MIKYRVELLNGYVEFVNESDANAYASENNGSVVSIEVPDPLPQLNLPPVSPRQMRQALIISGITLDQIEAALDTLPEPTKSLAKVEWEYSLQFLRENPLASQVAQMLGWTEEQLNDLWILAKSL